MCKWLKVILRTLQSSVCNHRELALENLTLTSYVLLHATYKFSVFESLLADVKQEAIESSDPRGEYDRTRTSIGINWEF